MDTISGWSIIVCRNPYLLPTLRRVFGAKRLRAKGGGVLGFAVFDFGQFLKCFLLHNSK